MEGRFEIKYKIPLKSWCVLKEKLNPYFRIDRRFGNYTVHSLYLDTPKLNSVEDKIEGHFYKCKNRIRFYGQNTNEKWFEQKIKLGDKSFKRREIYQTDSSYIMKPKCLISYERLAFECFFDPYLRINLDTLIRSSRRDTLDFSHSENNFILNPTWGIFEMKHKKNFPVWLLNILKESKMEKVSVSKYTLSMNHFRGRYG